MTEAYRRLSEGMPPQKPADSSSFPTDLRRVKAWVESLPRANQAATGKQLIEALESMRSVRFEGAQRLGVLEVLRPLLLDLASAAEMQCLGASIPLPPAKARAYEQLVMIERQLAEAYRFAVIEYCAPNGGVPFLRGGGVAQALQRALFHAARLAMHAYFMYQQPPAGLWRAMHSLFVFARSCKLEDKQVEDPAEQRHVTPAGIYLQALLIAFSNPFRFSQKEQAEFWRVSAGLSSQLQVSEHPTGEDCFGVPLDSDNGPGYIPAERAAGRDSLIWVDLAQLRALLDDQISQAQGHTLVLRIKGAKPLESSVEFLRRVRAGWARASARRNQRLTAGHVLDSVTGLASLHFYLAGMLDFDAFLGRAGVADTDNEDERASWTRAAVDAGRIPTQRAEVLDQSLGGYQLRWTAEESIKARVGEVIGLSVPASSDERHWLVGIVRWLRYAADGSVDAGIELLSRRARPVALRGLDGEAAGKPPQRGVQYESSRGGDTVRAGPLLFIGSTALEAMRGRVEVLRVPGAADIDEPVPMRETLGRLETLENAGDFLLMQGGK